ncbi:broad substrate specificity ATP-binding cassette transporter ABCG2-like isoform X2 [Biomphalaria glabrata]|uniref:Broad substrate specificity ATP-binding cassette transporter ABCG2-like isoform X2 n=1 Tax=Biomphalaria glabrata TaxID=6526 RepID=A0A9W3BES7_BIOGL|nr:broad substrate specificity ATP-binding cassette transporter ABCG2-like isoform X2 [Biomphalaria glabrata]
MAGREMTIFDVEKYNEKIAVTRKKASGAVLSAHNVSYTIKVASRFCSSEEKQILFDVTAIFKAGLTAVLGPTGSGKSSLLDILAGRKDNQRISGQLLLNGKPVPTNFKCMVGYVVQDDVVMGTLSVRENLTFSAALRLRASIKAAERKERINKVIKELGLEKCADTKVGNDFIRGVSGGERKRCNIGMELIISPQVLFLDEPTTGLDANTAKTVLLFLKRLARRGRTIVFSLHQPRFSIYKMFDTLLLLSQGHTVYFGPARDALHFFSMQGYMCEKHNNPPDFFLDVMNGDLRAYTSNKNLFTAEDMDSSLDSIQTTLQSPHELLVDGFRNSVWNWILQQEAQAIYALYKSNDGLKHKAVDYATSFGHQVIVVAKRALLNLIRNPQLAIFTIATSVIFSAVLAAIYWNVGSDPSKTFKDRHENSSGFYRVSAYFLVKVLFDMVPLRLVPVLILSSTVYFSVGLNSGAEHFFLFTFCLFCTAMGSSALCLLVSSIVSVFAVAQIVLGMCYVLMMLLGGFLISLNSVGPWLYWAQYLSFLKYALSALYITEFKDKYFCNNNKTVCHSGNAYLEDQDINYADPWDLWQNFVALLLYTVCLLLFAYLQLRIMKKTS